MLRLLVVVFGLALWAQAQPVLSLRRTGGANLEISWPAEEAGYTLEQTTSLAAPEGWSAVAGAEVLKDGQFTWTVQAMAVAQFFRLSLESLTGIESTSPHDGETDVAVTRESIIRFSGPLEMGAILKSDNFYATSAGRKILSRVEISGDRKQVTLFYLEPLPGGARVDVFLDAEDLFDANGQPLDPSDFPADHNILSFSTLPLTPLAQTAVIGTVYATELAGGTNKPLEGVTVTVDGMEQTLRAVTDGSGKFKLSPVPPGKFFVHIDGRTVVNEALGIHYPDKGYYPFVGKAWEAVAGREDNLAGETGTIFLPLIVAGTLQAVSQTAPTTVSFPSTVVASNPVLAGVSITVPANSLFNDNGVRGGKVGIAPVPPDRLPGPLPPGLELPIVITVQTDGALNFDQPAPVCFPNVVDPILGTPLPAGSKQSLVSFNHKKGVWEAVGTMTVSADGRLVCSDPGSGVLQPGWHGVGPPPDGPPPPPCGGEGTSALQNFSSQDSGRVGALETEEQCKSACATAKDKKLDAIQAALIERLGSCTFYAPNHVCPYIQGIISTAESDKEIALEDYDRCIKKCRRPPPMIPPPKPPKKPKSCRPRKPISKSVRASTVHSFEEPSTQIVDQITTIVDQIAALAAPFAGSDQPWPASVEKEVLALIASANALTGGDAFAYASNYYLNLETQSAAAGALDEPYGNAPDYPVYYVAEIIRPTGSLFLRGQTEPFGQYQLFVPRDGRIVSVRFYDPLTKSYDIIFPRLRADAPWRLPSFELTEIDETFPDADQDGLPDVVELVFGTDPHKADSDGDGAPDGAEIEQGTNALDGRPAQTGIIATLQTPGTTVDLSAAEGNVLTAEGASGVSLLSSYKGQTPILLAHVATGGNVRRVALAPPLGLASQVDAGLAVIDFSNLASPRILYTVQIPGAGPVVTDSLTAYVGSGDGSVVAIDLSSGTVLRELSVTNAVHDLALSGGYLYVLTDDQLIAISRADGSLTMTGAAKSPYISTPNRRLFVGGTVGYAVHGKGVNTFDFTHPGEPLLLKAGDSTQLGWKQLVANGSGVALVAVGPNSSDDGAHDVSLYDVSNSTNAVSYLTTFLTPGLASAVAIWNGLGYVADGSAGLQVINYLPFDGNGTPPVVTFSEVTNATLQLVEGTRATITATAQDDLQVRNIEFYLDDTFVQTDGSFPFEVTLRVPRFAPERPSYRLRAKAIDTGGNFSWSEEINISVLLDSTAPEVTSIYPRSVSAGTRTLSVSFNEEMDPASLSSTSLRLWGAGPDGKAGTADDVEIQGGIRAMTSDGRTGTLQLPNALAPGAYRLVAGHELADLRGNRLRADVIRNFRVVDALYWSARSGGDWNEPKNWSAGRVPSTNDDVLISAELVSTITFSRGESTIRSLLTEDRLLLTGGRLKITGWAQVNNLELRGGTLAAAQVIPGEEFKGIALHSGVLDDVTLGCDATLQTGDQIVVLNGFTLNGTLSISGVESYTGLTFQGAQTLGGTGQIVLKSSAYNYLSANAALTIGPGITIRCGAGTIGEASAPLINQGTIVAEVAGQSVRVQGHPLVNQGTFETKNDGIMSIAGDWTNSGVIKVTQSTLNLGGSFATASLGTIQRDGGTINLQGTLNNTNSVLTINDAAGLWILDGGIIQGGYVRSTGNGRLRLKAGVLDGATLDSDITMETGDQIRLLNGLTLNAALSLNAEVSYTGLIFQGAQTLGGTGQIVLKSSAYNYLSANAALTIGPGITIRCGAGTIGEASVPLINQGTIVAEVAGQSVRVQGHPLVNQGTFETKNDGIMSIAGDWTNSGVIKVTQSTLNLGGSFATASLGTIQRDGGTINLQGTLNNTNSVLTINDAAGLWILDGGIIQGGHVRSTGNGRLRLKAGVLDGATLDSDITMETGDQIRLLNGLTLNAALSLNAEVSYTGLIFQGAQTLGGTGQIVLKSSAYNYLSANAALTIGPGITIRCGAGTIGEASVPLINQGTIVAEVAGQSVRVQGHPLVNQGTFETKNDGIMSIAGDWTNSGVIKVTQSTLNLGGSFATASLGTIQRDGGTINLQGTLNNTNSVLTINDAAGLWILDGGIIQGGHVRSTGNGRLRLKAGVLDGATLDSDITMETGDQIRLLNGLTLNAALSLNAEVSYTGLIFQGAQTLGGTGQIVLKSSAYNYLSANAALTIGPGITIRCGAGTIGEASVPLINQGTIVAEVAGQSVRVQGHPLVNQGTFETKNDGIMSIAGDWTNSGVIKVTQSTLNLGGSFATANLGTIQRDGGTINLQGTLNNTNSVLTVNDSLGSWTLDSGTIQGGIIRTGGSADLELKAGILDGVTLDANLTLENGYQIRTVNGLTVNGTLTLAAATSSSGISLQGAQTLAGTGQVIFGGTSPLNYLSPNAALTIGPTLTIHGRSGTLGASSVPLINQGNIIADVNNETIIVRGTPFTNTGITNSLNGGRLLVNP